jgi:cytoskeletal protein CcmA (bactofilin family)
MSFFGGRRQQEKEPQEQKVTPKLATPPPPSPRQPVGFETVLGVTATLKGGLRSQGNIRLDGMLEGTLEIDGNVLVGETAKITADINARNISIAGAVRGNVNGNKVQILRTGRVWGDINAAAITTEEGAFIDGKITMVTHEAAAQNFEAPALPEPELVEPDFLYEDEPEPEPELEAPTLSELESVDAAVEEEVIAFEPELDDFQEDVFDDADGEQTIKLPPLGELPVDEDGAIG